MYDAFRLPGGSRRIQDPKWMVKRQLLEHEFPSPSRGDEFIEANTARRLITRKISINAKTDLWGMCISGYLPVMVLGISTTFCSPYPDDKSAATSWMLGTRSIRLFAYRTSVSTNRNFGVIWRYRSRTPDGPMSGAVLENIAPTAAAARVITSASIEFVMTADFPVEEKMRLSPGVLTRTYQQSCREV
jgi:hypothetical protein